MAKKGGRFGRAPFWWSKGVAEIGGAPFFGGQKGWQKRVADLAAALFGGQKGWQKLAASIFWWSKRVAEKGGRFGRAFFWWSKGVAEIGGMPFLVVKRGGRKGWQITQKGAQPNLPPLSATPFDHQNEGRPNLPPFCHPF